MALALGACQWVQPDEASRPETAQDFPQAHRPVSTVAGSQFSNETQRDSVGEAAKVMDLAEIRPGMTVADIGAGEGYYTVRLAEKVGSRGRVLAGDIDREVLNRLGQRVERERLDNVSLKLGTPDDPKLPENSFDRVFLVHMYHEVQEPYAFLWRLWPSLREEGRVIVVDVDRPTSQHGIDPLLLSCEFERVGFKLDAFRDAPELAGYYAQFKRAATRPEPAAIKPCRRDTAADTGATR
jgi:ubiquinone/menaquinone biosynthesis C-methylase UbiE